MDAELYTSKASRKGQCREQEERHKEETEECDREERVKLT